MNYNIEIPPFYVGQEVVANCDYTYDGKTYFKKGDEFVIQAILKPCCNMWSVKIGVFNPYGSMYCHVCKANRPAHEFEFLANRFSPKLEIKAFLSMKELADVELFSVN